MKPQDHYLTRSLIVPQKFVVGDNFRGWGTVVAVRKVSNGYKVYYVLVDDWDEYKKANISNPQSFLSDPEGITIRLIKGSGEQLKKILGRSFRVSSTKKKTVKTRRKNPQSQRYFENLARAKKVAKENSKNGYVQHVEKYSTPSDKKIRYRISDWYDYLTTVVSYENGRQL